MSPSLYQVSYHVPRQTRTQNVNIPALLVVNVISPSGILLSYATVLLSVSVFEVVSNFASSTPQRSQGTSLCSRFVYTCLVYTCLVSSASLRMKFDRGYVHPVYERFVCSGVFVCLFFVVVVFFLSLSLSLRSGSLVRYMR